MSHARRRTPATCATGRTLQDDYPTLDALRCELPGLILRYNLHGVDIDLRCTQIAQIALWMRAQRALQQFGAARVNRPFILRTNIVVAEPMPGEADLQAEFISKLEDPALGAHFKKLVDRMKLAGELGILLRIDELVRPSTGVGQTLELFTPPAERIRLALDRFESDTITHQPRRRLFIEDAAQGLGFLEFTQMSFAVVLTNPPFGAATKRTEEFLEHDDCGNLYCAFVRRALELGASAVGCITDRTFLVQSTFRPFRSRILESDVSLHLLGDLGWGVLDANVQSAAYVLYKRSDDCCAFSDARSLEAKAAAIKADSEHWRWARTSSFTRLPDSVLAYALPLPVLTKVRQWKALADLASFPRGLGSNKAARTYLAWVEVPETSLGSGRRWEALANGGEFSPFWRQDLGVADWRSPSGKLWIEMNPSDRRPYDQSGVTGYFKPGLSFPKQSSSFNVAVLPQNFLPTREGKAIILETTDDIWPMLAYLNSGPVRAFVRDTCGLHKQSGSIGRIPVPHFDSRTREKLAHIGKRLAEIARDSFAFDETSRFYVGPAALHKHAETEAQRSAEAEDMLSEIDHICLGLSRQLHNRDR